MKKPIHVLIVEDSEDDALLIVRELKRGGYDPLWKRVQTAAAMRAALKKEWDIILADYRMPQFTGVDALKIVQQKGLDIPFILISGTIGEKVAVKAMKAGAHDYIMKENLQRLVPAVEREIREGRRRERQNEVEEILDESEEKYRLLFDTAPNGILHVNVKGTIISCNSAFLRLTGFKRNDIVGIHFTKLPTLPKKKLPEYITMFADMVAGKKIKNFEFEWLHADGSPRWGEGNTSLMKKDGKIIGVQIIVSDITERKKTEEELQTLFDMSLDMICIADINTATFTKINPAFTQTLGYSEKYLKGRSFLQFVHPDDRQKTIDVIEQKLKEGKTVIQFENRYRVKGGGYRWLSWSSHPIPQRGITFAMARDVTERKRSEENLKTSEANLKMAQRIAKIGNWSWYIPTDTAKWSDEVYRIFKAPKKEPSYEFAKSFVHPDDVKHWQGTIQKAVKNQKPFSLDYRAVRTDGRTIWIHNETKTVFDDKGKFTGYQGTVQDIAERKLMEDKLKESEELHRITMENITDPVFITDDHGNFTFICSNTQHTIGYRQSEIENMGNISKLVGDDLFDIEKLNKRKTISNIESTIRDKKGRKRHFLITVKRVSIKQGTVLYTCHDITDRKQAEETLRKSEKGLRQILDATTDGIWTWNFKTDKLFFSPKYYTMLGYKPNEFPADFENWVNLIHPDDRENALAVATEYLKTKPDTYENEFRLRTKKGDYRWIHTRGRVVERDDKGHAIHMIGNHEDITERKQAVFQINYQANLLANVKDAIMATDRNFKILYWNKTAEKQYGWTSDEVIGNHFVNFIQPRYTGDSRKTVMRTIVKEGSWSGELLHNHRDGTCFPVLTTISEIKDAYGRVSGHIAVIRDITDRKRAENALSKSEEKWKSLAENAPSFVSIVNRDHLVEYINHPVTRLTLEDVFGRSVYDFIQPEYHDIAREKIDSVFATGKPSSFESVASGPDGTLSYYDNRLGPIIVDGNITAVSIFGTDITESKQAEEALRESEARFSTIFHSNPAAIALTRLRDNHLIDVNQGFLNVTGYARDEVIEHAPSDLNLWFDPAERDEAVKTILKEEKVRGEYQIRHKTGDIRDLLFSAELIELSGERYLLSMGMDITERKQHEEALRESESRFRDLAEMLPEAVFETDRHLNITYANRRAFEIFGYTQEDMKRGLNGLAMIAPEDRDRAKENITLRLKGGDPGTVEYKAIKKDGTIFPILFHASATIKNGELEGFRGVMIDISEHKRAQNAVIEAKEKLEAIFNSAGDGIVYSDKKGVVLEVNPMVTTITGIPKEEIIGKGSIALAKKFFSPKEIPHILSSIKNALSGKPIKQLEVEFKDKVLEISVPVKKGLPGVTGIIRDVTDRKKADEQIRMLGTAVENTTDGVAITDLDGRIIYINNTILDLYGYTRKDLMNAFAFQLNASPEDTASIVPIVQEKGQWSGEIEQRRKDGSTFPCNLTLFTIPDRHGNPLYIVSFISDITHKKEASEKIKASLREKEMLLKEIHHRVKNNLQIIISLLNLQSQRIADDKALSAFRESRNRIHSMALVHEKLYQSKDFSRIDFDTYIEDMTRELFRGYEITGRVFLDLQLDHVTLGIDVAIPCGLIINELVTNAMKHAFPKGKKGNIYIHLKEKAQEQVEMIVQDNGTGLPDTIDIQTTDSLGLQLVKILTEQINATLTITRDKGTAFRILFSQKK